MGGVGFNGGIGAAGAGLGGKRVIPTFGVSFGLPVPAGPSNGYPINPYGSYPLQNPYFGAISSNGLNLGLVNVNPLVSFQVAKNEFGEKLFRPLVNLHVTPNANIVQQVGAYLKAKQHGSGGPSYNKHFHSHTHLGSPPEVHHPHHYDGPPHLPVHGYNGGPNSFDGPAPNNYDGPPGAFNHGPPVSSPGYYPSAPNTGYEYAGPNFNGPSPHDESGYAPAGFPPNGPHFNPGLSPNNGYGFHGRPGPNGLFRDANNNNDYNDNTDPNNYNGRNYYNDTDDGQNALLFQYQDLYPQNEQLQTNSPYENHYADKFQNYDNPNSIQSESAVKNHSPVGRNSKAIKFPTSRRRKRSTTFNAIEQVDEKPLTNHILNKVRRTIDGYD